MTCVGLRAQLDEAVKNYGGALRHVDHWRAASVRINQRANAAEAENVRLRAQLDEIRKAARHPHKGPVDTDTTMLIAAAERVEGGYMAGGSNTQATVGRVLRTVAAVLADTPAPTEATT